MPSARAVPAGGKGDALDRELALLAETTSLSNPLTYGHKNDWQTAKRVDELTAKHEGEYAKTLPKTFVLTEPQRMKGAFAVAAKAAQHPTQPMRPNKLSESGASGSTSSSKQPTASDSSSGAAVTHAAAIVVASRVRVPLAKRSHMDGVLRGLPSSESSGPARSTQADAFAYDGEMADMHQHKDLAFHRKRDAYSDYVEARARFSKMHSVT